ncbi:helix-turn-helix domain-containing protein [bacterium]|nr:helix-turn-helix domain-containing protein [bacterium]
MTAKLQPLAQLSMLLSDMEQELGLEELSHFEKQVLLAVVDCASEADSAQLADIQKHKLTQEISRPSLFRALKQLEETGQIERLGGKRGRYVAVNA